MTPYRRDPRGRARWFGVALLLGSTLGGACARDGHPAGEGVRAVAGSGGAAPVADSVASLPDSTFARLQADLSEPEGYFDTDNLISNEASYLQVMGALDALGVHGGAYVGVGPDQSFAYMAAIRPRIAFILDIRRDNALEHLMFKALFETAPTRVEYLCLLLGRAPPAEPAPWDEATIETILGWVDRPSDPEAAQRARAVVDSAVVTFGIPLSDRDRATIHRFHDAFIAGGLRLRFHSFGRAPRPWYPTLEQLLRETDLAGRSRSYLASRDDYLFLREMQRKNLVIPVVGDLAGDHALGAVAREVRRRGETVSALYVSNVEFYLFQQGSFARFAANVALLPAALRSVLVRSYFPNRGGPHPLAVPGYYSTQSLQTLQSFQEAAAHEPYRSYGDLVTRDAIDPRGAAGAVRDAPEAVRE